MAATCTTVSLSAGGQALALAQSNEAAIASANASMDSMWLIFGGAMVFFQANPHCIEELALSFSCSVYQPALRLIFQEALRCGQKRA